MSKYILSEEAETDIEVIFDFGEYKFRYLQAITYLTELQNHFFSLSINPHIGKKSNEIKKGIYSLPYKSVQNNFMVLSS